MMRPGQWPIRWQLRLLIAVLALPYAGLLAFQARQADAERREAAAGRLAVLAQAAAADTAQFLAETGALLAGLADRADVKAMGKRGCDPVFATFAAQNRDYANLLLLDEAGWVRCSAMTLNPGQRVSVAPQLNPARPSDVPGLLVGLPRIGPISGRWVVPAIYPVRDGAGNVAGYIGVSIDLDRLAAFRRQGAAGVFLVDDEGLVLAAGAGVGVKSGTQQDAVFVAALAAAGARGGPLADEADRDGPLLVSARVAGTDWFAVAAGGPPQPAAMAPLAAFGAAVAGALLLALLLARRLAQAVAVPVRRLGESAAAIAGGESASRIPPGGAVEVAAAAQAMNRMLDGFDAALDSARRREWELRAMLDAIDKGVYAETADGGAMRYLNPAAEALYGGDVRHFATAPRLRHAGVLKEDRPRLEALAGQLRQTGRGEAEYRIRRGDGQVRWLRERCRLLYDAGGTPVVQIGVVSDVTAGRELIDGLKQSEARFRSLMDLSSDWYWEQDAEFRFVELTGTPKTDAMVRKQLFIGKRRWEAPTVGLSEAQWAAHRARLSRHEPFRDFEYGAVLPDGGGTVYMRISGEPVFDAAGNFTGYRGVGSDITARKEAEMQLRKLSAAVEQSPVSIVITDTRGDIEYVNPRFCQATGYAPEEVRGRNPRFLKSGETPAETYATLWRTIAGGGEWSGELHNRRKNGELFWEFVKIIPLLSEKGEVMNYMAVKEDITPYKELTAREQLRQEQMLHHARLAAMGEMAAALAHELNQPLAAIANFSGVVEHQLGAPRPDLAQAREVVRSINAQALRAGNIVWRVREFSRKQEARREPSDINGLIGDVVRLADIAAKSREVDYEYELAAGLPPVPADRVQIEQVLLNLIRNGVEAMDGMDGEKRLRLASRLAENGEAVQISVSDRGRGLPDRIAVDLITPFFTTKPEGMGMGLSISRGIVEAHGGRLWAAPNEDGAGTTFHFTLLLNAEKK